MFLRAIFGILMLTVAICSAEQPSKRREICNVACPLEKPCPYNCEVCYWPQGTKCCPQIGEPVCKKARPPICSNIHCPERLPCPKYCKKCEWPVGSGCCPYLRKPICVDSEEKPSPMSLKRSINSDGAHKSNEQVSKNNMETRPIKRAEPSSAAAFCPEYVIPCPKECPDTCIRPAGVSCPLTHPGWCPNWCSGHHVKPTRAGSVQAY